MSAPFPLDTLPKLLRANAQRTPQHVALREKHLGIWQSISWEDYWARVRDFALGLRCLGFQRGDRIIIIGDNRPEWVISELAAQALGGAPVGIYQDSAPDEVAFIAAQCDTRFVVAEDQEQVDKLIAIYDQLPSQPRVIYYDPKGLRSYDARFLMAFPEVEALGRAEHERHPHLFDHEVDAGRHDDVALISTTSGTTSRPKLAQIVHGNLIAMGHGLAEVDGYTAQDDFLSFLPMAWIGEQMMSVACGLVTGFALSFPEDPSTVQADLREIGPRILFAPPRIWESMVSQVQVRVQDADRLKRAVFHWGLAAGQRVADARFAKRRPSPVDTLAFWMAYHAVFRNLLDQLGLVRVRNAYTAGAALGPDIFRFFHAMGVNLKQGYGQTETTGICVVHRTGDIKFQTVGHPLDGVEVMVDDHGEILVRGTVAFHGYFRNEAATADTLVEGGWVRTGDAGYFDSEGHLIVIDRVKDVMTLHDGTRFSPQFIENKLKFSPHIKEAVVFGGDYPFVTAMINIDFGNVGKWAENHKMAYTTYTDLAHKPEVYALVRKEVERTNADLPEAARIRRFLLLHKELDADDAELTRTRKVRRGFVAQRYADIVAGLYGEEPDVRVASTITYQDGRTAILNVTIPVEHVGADTQPIMQRQRA